MNANTSAQRPFWSQVGADPAATTNSWPISDLSTWLKVTVLKPGFACQVLWREQHHARYRHQNFRTTTEAARFARSLIANQGTNLLDVGISPSQPLALTEFG
jgi:hypothetical protein